MSQKSLENEKDAVQSEASEVHRYYLEHWDNLSSQMIEQLNVFGTGYKTLTLNQFIQLACTCLPKRKEGFKLLMKANQTTFNFVLDKHDLDKKSITLIIQNFNILFSSDKEALTQKLLYVHQKINQKCPELVEHFLDSIKSMRSDIAKNAAQTILEKEQLEHNISLKPL